MIGVNFKFGVSYPAQEIISLTTATTKLCPHSFKLLFVFLNKTQSSEIYLIQIIEIDTMYMLSNNS